MIWLPLAYMSWLQPTAQYGQTLVPTLSASSSLGRNVRLVCDAAAVEKPLWPRNCRGMAQSLSAPRSRWLSNSVAMPGSALGLSDMLRDAVGHVWLTGVGDLDASATAMQLAKRAIVDCRVSPKCQ